MPWSGTPRGGGSWSRFIDSSSRYRSPSGPPLAPPRQRSKARFMNVDVLADWAEKPLKLLDSPKAIRAAGWKPAQVEAKLAWLRKFAPQVRRWREMLAVIEATEHYVRHEGIHSRPSARAGRPSASANHPRSALASQTAVGVRGTRRSTGARRRTSVGIERSVGIDYRQVQVPGWRTRAARDDGNGPEHWGFGRKPTGGHRASGHAGNRHPRRVDMVSIASWPHGAKHSSTDHTSSQPGTKTETIMPRKRLTLSPSRLGPQQPHPVCVRGPRRPGLDPRLLADLPKLAGKVLGCYCHALPCDGEVLLRLLKERGLE
jgi:hypothetical protein